MSLFSEIQTGMFFYIARIEKDWKNITTNVPVKLVSLFMLLGNDGNIIGVFLIIGVFFS